MIDWKVYVRQHPRYGVWYQRVERQPSWVVKTAVALAVLIVVVPLVLLFLAAVAVGLIAFLVLGVAAAIWGGVARLLGGGGGGPLKPRPGWRHDDGRRNVRVIRD